MLIANLMLLTTDKNHKIPKSHMTLGVISKSHNYRKLHESFHQTRKEILT